jgi:hypothetical protein
MKRTLLTKQGLSMMGVLVNQEGQGTEGEP